MKVINSLDFSANGTCQKPRILSLSCEPISEIRKNTPRENNMLARLYYGIRNTFSDILNQVRAGLWLAHAWFIRIASVHECLYGMYVSAPRLLKTSGVM